MEIVYDWRFWILYAPQYHLLMFVLVVVVMFQLARLNMRLKRLQKGRDKRGTK